MVGNIVRHADAVQIENLILNVLKEAPVLGYIYEVIYSLYTRYTSIIFNCVGIVTLPLWAQCRSQKLATLRLSLAAEPCAKLFALARVLAGLGVFWCNERR